jgi:hypothetical protein
MTQTKALSAVVIRLLAILCCLGQLDAGTFLLSAVKGRGFDCRCYDDLWRPVVRRNGHNGSGRELVIRELT